MTSPVFGLPFEIVVAVPSNRMTEYSRKSTGSVTRQSGLYTAKWR
jgi:hypothetical protein